LPKLLLLPLTAAALLGGCIGRDNPPSKPAPAAQQALAYRDLDGVWSCGRATSSEFRDGTVTMTTVTSEKTHAQAVVRANYEIQGNELRLTVQGVHFDGGQDTHPDLVTVERISNFNGTSYHFERVALYQDGRMQPQHSSIGTGGDCTKSS
jgi:hypothetical protein